VNQPVKFSLLSSGKIADASALNSIQMNAAFNATGAAIFYFFFFTH
jgi:hypothetical protein